MKPRGREEKLRAGREVLEYLYRQRLARFEPDNRRALGLRTIEDMSPAEVLAIAVRHGAVAVRPARSQSYVEAMTRNLRVQMAGKRRRMARHLTGRNVP